jgi:hypothetical protein
MISHKKWDVFEDPAIPPNKRMVRVCTHHLLVRISQNNATLRHLVAVHDSDDRTRTRSRLEAVPPPSSP